MKNLFRNNQSERVLLLFFALLYILLPCGFSSTDAWYYAACIKHSTDLLHPFHLIYNLFGKIVCIFPSGNGVDTLAYLKAMNAVFGVLSLYIVMLILKQMKKKKPEILLITALCGSSFSVMRYATENETYIIPLFLALTSSYFFMKYLLSGGRQMMLISVFFASLSVLFHLSYLIWLVCILAGAIIIKDYKVLSAGIVISLIIPVAYIFSVFITEGNLGFKALKEFTGSRSLSSLFSVSLSGLLLSAISLVRSFIQIHGYIANMFKENWLNIIPALFSVCFCVLAVLHVKDLKKQLANRMLVLIHLMIAALMFIFGFISDGNAEFMVMIPVLFFIISAAMFKGGEKFYMLLLSGMLIWNTFYGLIPLNKQTGEIEFHLCNILVQKEGEVAVIARDDQQIASMVFYYTGRNDYRSIYQSPAVMKLSGRDPEMLREVIDSLLARGSKIYTDCLSVMPLSRAVLLEGKINRQFFSTYILKEELRKEDTGGIRIIHLITGKNS